MTKRYSHHPVAGLWPMMSKAAQQQLADSIKANGLREPIALLDGKILDGRNREAACLQAGVKPTYVTLPKGTDPLTYATDKNEFRRHMTKAQRKKLWIELRKQGMSYRQIAEKDGTVNPTTVMRGVANATPAQPKVVAGKDGKKYKPKAKASSMKTKTTGKLWTQVAREEGVLRVNGGGEASTAAKGKLSSVDPTLTFPRRKLNPAEEGKLRRACKKVLAPTPIATTPPEMTDAEALALIADLLKTVNIMPDEMMELVNMDPTEAMQKNPHGWWMANSIHKKLGPLGNRMQLLAKAERRLTLQLFAEVLEFQREVFFQLVNSKLSAAVKAKRDKIDREYRKAQDWVKQAKAGEIALDEADIRHLQRKDGRRLLQLLHPDKHNGDPKFAEGFSILKKLMDAPR